MPQQTNVPCPGQAFVASVVENRGWSDSGNAGVTMATRGIRTGNRQVPLSLKAQPAELARQRIAHDALDAACPSTALRAAAQTGIYFARKCEPERRHP